jgi:hypothetical protein
MAAATPIPTLSEVQTLDTSYLLEAHEYWTHTGNMWDQVFTEVHTRMSTPAGTQWEGQAAAAGQDRAYIDLIEVRGAAFQLHEVAGIARHGDTQLQARKEDVLDAVQEARRDGFAVGEHYSVSDRCEGGSAEFQAERLAQAKAHAAFIRHRVAALVATDRQLTAQITAATEGIDDLTFEEPGVDDTIVGDDKRTQVQAVDHHTFKDAPNPAPAPPPGGWSQDPLMRAAQKIAYGHALDASHHLKDFPNLTPDQLADLVHQMMQDSINNPKGLILGNSSTDGAPVIYDPKTNTVLIFDPTGEGRGSDSGTVFKPEKGSDYVTGNQANNTKPKINERVGSFSPSQFEPRPQAPPAAGQPAPVKPPAPAPVEAAPPVKPPPSIDEGGESLPKLPFGIGIPGDSPALGPQFVHPPHSIHRPPVLGEDPEEFED